MGNQFQFVNLDYWFCLVYSLFGGTCGGGATTTEAVIVDQGVSGTGGTALDAAERGASEGSSWFMSIFGDGGAGVGAATTTSVQGGFFSSVFETGGFVVGVFGGFVWFVWSLYSAVALTFSAILFLVIVGALLGTLLIRYREISKYSSLPPERIVQNPTRSRWQELLADSMSSDPKRWRESILGADVLLGELLEKFDYPGNTTADKLRAIPDDAFVTLPAAWEAHRVRNFVSTGASDFILTQREAFRVMKLYERVFEEFKYI